MSSVAALAANAVAIEPANVHANRTGSSTVIGTIRAAETINAINCRNGGAPLPVAMCGAASFVSRGRFAKPVATPPTLDMTTTFPGRSGPTAIRRHSGAMGGGATTTSSATTANSGSRPEARPRRGRRLGQFGVHQAA
jgi:hypothetical protein